MKRPCHQTLQLTSVSGWSGPGPVNWPQEAGPGLQGQPARHSCAVTGASVYQLLPGSELPSPMPTARRPDELPVSSPIPFLPLLSPPGKSHCFTFRWMLRPRSAPHGSLLPVLCGRTHEPGAFPRRGPERTEASVVVMVMTVMMMTVSVKSVLIFAVVTLKHYKHTQHLYSFSAVFKT